MGGWGSFESRVDTLYREHVLYSKKISRKEFPTCRVSLAKRNAP